MSSVIYAVRTASGDFTGVVYAALLPEAVAHHRQFGEVLVAVAGLEEVDGAWLEVIGDLPTARAVATRRMKDWIADFLSQFTTGVPAEEIASWPVKAAAARAHLAGDAQPLIVAEAALTGETPDDLAQRIAERAITYTAIIARITGLRRATEVAIAAATTPSAVVVALAEAQKTALSMAAQMGLPQPKER